MGKYQLKLALMQPTFNPWLGYFDLIDYVDIFVFLDTVQLNQKSWQTRNKLKIQGKEFLFSLPIVKNKARQELLIQDTLLNFSEFDFRKKLSKTLNRNYKKAKHYNSVNNFIQELVSFDTKYLSQYNINIIQKISEKLEFDTKLIILSQTDYKCDLSKGDLVLNVCKYFDTNMYISPLGSKEYLDKAIDSFFANSIGVCYQYYKHPKYNQIEEDFIPYIGIFDLLYNEGFDNAKSIIKSGRNYKKAE